jgi:hypothetical protein
MQVLSEGSAAYTTKAMKPLAGIANIGHYILEKLKRAQRGSQETLIASDLSCRLGTREQIQRLSSLVNFEPSSVRLYIKPF